MLTEYMDPSLVTFIEAESRDEVLKKLVHLIYQAGKIKDKEEFFNAILKREKIVSTGIGMGVAIPHAKLPAFDLFFIAIAILKKPLPWHSLDGSPVRIVFMIGGPDDKQTEYLQLLSRLTQTIKNEEIRKKLLNLSETNNVIELFETI